ncbi:MULTISPECIES: J-domain-containing protein [unclassified Saccharothrix]|uniref:DnaJ family domain-containing protein n=1 Tax=unclassified Saccharothrix TaxID=2593673 RepID=UPI00307F86AC
MTQRKPAGVGFETWVERQIREAQEKGEFDGLPGAGKPLAGLSGAHDELWWVKEKVRREEGSVLPPTLQLRKEAAEAREAAGRAASEEEVRRILGEINAKITEAIRKPMSGPPLNLMTFDVEHVVREWRLKRS